MGVGRRAQLGGLEHIDRARLGLEGYPVLVPDRAGVVGLRLAGGPDPFGRRRAVVVFVPVPHAGDDQHPQAVAFVGAVAVGVLVDDLGIVHLPAGGGRRDLAALIQGTAQRLPARAVQRDQGIRPRGGVVGHDGERVSAVDRELDPVLVVRGLKEVRLGRAVGGDVAGRGAGVVRLKEVARAAAGREGQVIVRQWAVRLLLVPDAHIVQPAGSGLPVDARAGAKLGDAAACAVQLEQRVGVGAQVPGLDRVADAGGGREL